MDSFLYVSSANRACSLLYSYIKKHATGIWLLPVNVCPDVPLTFGLAGVPFEFVDIDPCTLCVNVEDIIIRIKKAPSIYAGIVYVRTYGFLKDTNKEFNDIKAINSEISIIDDRCLCLPEDTPFFYGSDMVLYSTGHCKQIDLGGGGIAFYKTKTLYDIDKDLVYDGTDEEFLYKEAYKNEHPLNEMPKGWLKMDTFMSPSDYLKKINETIPERVKRRDLLNSIYSEYLPSDIQFPEEYNNWRFNIKVSPQNKEKVLQELFENSLFASNHYHSVNRLFDSRIYKYSDSLYQTVVNLFNDNYYTEAQAYKTCEIINNIVK